MTSLFGGNHNEVEGMLEKNPVGPDRGGAAAWRSRSGGSRLGFSRTIVRVMDEKRLRRNFTIEEIEDLQKRCGVNINHIFTFMEILPGQDTDHDEMIRRINLWKTFRYEDETMQFA